MDSAARGRPTGQELEGGDLQASQEVILQEDREVLTEDTLQEQVEEQEAPAREKFGTFAGVFTPTLLTILGVIMYLRLGSVVGNAGLLGAWIIVLIAFAITGFTGLSMSSITTNIRIGAGGAYSIISQSLGLEVGGSIGIPLYLAQALAVTMYIFGFREGWQYIFPNHSALVVDLVTFGILFVIAFISAGLAFRIQYIIMAIIIGSLLSIILAAVTGSMQHPVTWLGDFRGFPETGFRGTDFWVVFALFFPAATGIMAGANMSGDLENPRRSIPIGTLSAIGLSLLVYVGLAYWLARSASMQMLTENYYVMVDRAIWGPAVLGGLLGATFSSGLSSLVGAPRILQALGEHAILPGGRWFAKQTEAGEPRNALWITGVIVLGALMLRDLNAVAPLITMFFLITYAMINVVVLIEQSLGLVSFRPLFHVPRVVPFLGAAGCLFAMFIVNPVFGLIAAGVVIVVYGVLLRRRLIAPFGDVRSGLFVNLAEWAAKKVSGLPASPERAWKPNLLVPVDDTRELRGTFRFIHDITYPKGSVKLIGLASEGEVRRLTERISHLSQSFRDEDVFASWAVLEADGYRRGVMASMQALGGVFFRPNILFLTLPENTEREEDVGHIFASARENRLGLLLFADHPKAKLGRQRTINLWVRDQSPDWRLSMELSNLNLAVLTAIKLKRNWHNAQLNLITVVRDADQIANAEEYLNRIVELARIPGDSDVYVVNQDFASYVAEAPHADLNIFGLPSDPDFDFVRHMVDETRAACVFVRDSGDESALA